VRVYIVQVALDTCAPSAIPSADSAGGDGGGASETRLAIDCCEEDGAGDGAAKRRGSSEGSRDSTAFSAARWRSVVGTAGIADSRFGAVGEYGGFGLDAARDEGFELDAASCDGGLGDCRGFGLGVATLSCSIGLGCTCPKYGEKRARFGSGNEGVGLVETTVRVSGPSEPRPCPHHLPSLGRLSLSVYSGGGSSSSVVASVSACVSASPVAKTDESTHSYFGCL